MQNRSIPGLNSLNSKTVYEEQNAFQIKKVKKIKTIELECKN